MNKHLATHIMSALIFAAMVLSVTQGCGPRVTRSPGEGRIARSETGGIDRTEVTRELVRSATDAERILGIEWALLPERDRPEQMALFLSILSSVYHSQSTGDDLDWTVLRPTMKPLLEQALQRWPMQEGRVYIHGLTAKMAAAFEMKELIPDLRLLMSRERGHARRYAIEALGRLKDAQSVPSFKQMLRVMSLPGELGGGRDFSTMIYAARALYQMDDQTGMDYIRQFLTFPSATIQAQVAAALADTRDESVVPVLIEVMEFPRVFPIPVLEALGRYETREAVQALTQRLDSEDVRVRQTAALVLARRGDRKALDVLLKDAQSGDSETAYLSLMALAALEDPRTPELLKRIYPQVSKARMVAAGAVLASMGDREGAALLANLLRDSSWGYRSAAAAMVLLYVQQ